MTFPQYCARQATKAFGVTLISIAIGVALGMVLAEHLHKRPATEDHGSRIA